MEEEEEWVRLGRGLAVAIVHHRNRSLSITLSSWQLLGRHRRRCSLRAAEHLLSLTSRWTVARCVDAMAAGVILHALACNFSTLRRAASSSRGCWFVIGPLMRRRLARWHLAVSAATVNYKCAYRRIAARSSCSAWRRWALRCFCIEHNAHVGSRHWEHTQVRLCIRRLTVTAREAQAMLWGGSAWSHGRVADYWGCWIGWSRRRCRCVRGEALGAWLASACLVPKRATSVLRRQVVLTSRAHPSPVQLEARSCGLDQTVRTSVQGTDVDSTDSVEEGSWSSCNPAATV